MSSIISSSNSKAPTTPIIQLVQENPNFSVALLGGRVGSTPKVLNSREIKVEPICEYTDCAKEAAVKAQSIAMNKMWKNAEEAINDHRNKIKTYTFPSVEECLPPMKQLMAHAPTSPLSFSHFVCEDKHSRPSMEDAHLFKKIEGGAIAGVFDGHGGPDVAGFVRDSFEEQFLKFMKETSGNIRESFISSINHIDTEVAKNEDWDDQGTTAVICYIDEKSHLIYTATLGDSKANIYRKGKEDKLVSIPLSCIRNWAHPKEAKRISIALEDPTIADTWIHLPAQSLQHPYSGLVLSRAIGDAETNKQNAARAVTSKPKISVNLLHSGDIVIIASDGLRDFVSETEIIDKVTTIKDKSTISKELVDLAKKKPASSDNMTVLTVNIN